MDNDISPECKNSQHNHKIIRSFGRIKSRKLSTHKNAILTTKFKDYELKDFLQNNSKNYLEIGFGFGDFLFEKAKQNPQINFYGCEPHINGIVNLLAKLENNPLANLQISNQDIRLVIEKFPDDFFEQIYILFPDPWPKSKHFKRRLIDNNFLDNLLAPKLKDSGKIIIATDHDSYKTWILSHILLSKKFSWNATSKSCWQNFPNDWIITKYHQKALNEKRVPILIEINKYKN